MAAFLATPSFVASLSLMWAKLSALGLALACVAWVAVDPGWEPFITLLSSIVAAVGLEIRDQRRLSATGRTLAHDTELFRRFDALLSEKELFDETRGALWNRETNGRFRERLEDYYTLGQRTEGRFLNSEVQSAFEVLVENLARLDLFILRHFFMKAGHARSAGEVARLYLYPDLKHESDGVWDKYSTELLELLENIETSYKSFRSAVKEQLAL